MFNMPTMAPFSETGQTKVLVALDVVVIVLVVR